MEATIRLLPGVLGNEESSEQDSFAVPAGAPAEVRHGLLDCPHYTRPAEFRDWKVPDVLLSGNHEQIRQWRRQRALEKTWRRRPDLLAQVPLSEEDRRWLESLDECESEPVTGPHSMQHCDSVAPEEAASSCLPIDGGSRPQAR